MFVRVQQMVFKLAPRVPWSYKYSHSRPYAAPFLPLKGLANFIASIADTKHGLWLRACFGLSTYTPIYLYKKCVYLHDVAQFQSCLYERAALVVAGGNRASASRRHSCGHRTCLVQRHRQMVAHPHHRRRAAPPCRHVPTGHSAQHSIYMGRCVRVVRVVIVSCGWKKEETRVGMLVKYIYRFVYTWCIIDKIWLAGLYVCISSLFGEVAALGVIMCPKAFVANVTFIGKRGGLGPKARDVKITKWGGRWLYRQVEMCLSGLL